MTSSTAAGEERPDDRRALRFVRFEADSADLERFRRFARRNGSVLEGTRRSIFAIGAAERLPLVSGLDDRDEVLAVGKALAALVEIDPRSGRELAGDGGSASTAAGPAAAGVIGGGVGGEGASARARPLAFAALPFDRGASSSLVIPETLLVDATGGASTIVLVGEDPASLVARAGPWLDRTGSPVPDPGPPLAPPDSFMLRSTRPHDEFRELVADAVADVGRGLFEKVVLVREVFAEANRPFDVAAMTAALKGLYPTCAIFSIGGFVGASPELLVSRYGRVVASHPLAGTVGRSGDRETDARLESELLGSAKERAEHSAVVDAVASAMRPVCDELDVPSTPSVVELRNVSHLGTLVRGVLSPTAAGTAGPGALELVSLLHPTPAVAGTPRTEALEWIAKHEGVERGPYAGAVGWVDAGGDGEWFVGIRAALVEGSTARLYAGVGVVADSDPQAELVETQLKLQALLAAAIRP